jgi:hypothetical protein
MLVGRPHEAAGNGSPRWMAAGPRHAGAQNPAYRPARLPPIPATCTDASADSRAGHILGTFVAPYTVPPHVKRALTVFLLRDCGLGREPGEHDPPRVNVVL